MGLLAGLVQQSFQGLEDLMLQKGELPLQRRADAAHYVRGHGGLGIEHGGLAQGFAGGKLQQAGGQGGGADIYGQAQAAGHGGKGPEGCFAGKLDAGAFRGLRQGDLSVAQKGRLAGQPRTRGHFGGGGLGETAGDFHGAFAALAPPAAGALHGKAVLRQQIRQNGRALKGQAGAGGSLAHG